MIEMRLRTRIPDSELDGKIGKILGPADYNALLTGPARVLKPNGQPLVVYLPGVLRQHTQNPDTYEILHALRSSRTENRGSASGSERVKSGSGNKTRALPVPSAIAGAFDAAGHHKYCRLTAWTGQNLPQWQALAPLLRDVSLEFARHVPDRFAVQMKAVSQTPPEWSVPGTPFSTVTVNNTYPTGVHQDAGDLATGFSTLTCFRRGTYSGGVFVFPRWRIALDMQDGDLALIDAHEWHGNTPIVCACGQRRNGWCETCKAERISTVAYFREKLTLCGTLDQETAKAMALADARSAKGMVVTDG